MRSSMSFSVRSRGAMAAVTQVDKVDCAVLSDQVQSLDWKIRHAKKKATVSADVMLHVRVKMKAMLQIQ